MPEFLNLLPPDAARRLLLDGLTRQNPTELIPTANATGRITAEDVRSGEPLPAFARSTVDGYAVRSKDTFGASDSLPAYLNQIGEVPMGDAPGFRLSLAQCALIHTGGMLPEGADAVVMLEYTQALQTGEIEIQRAVAQGENVLQKGEDVAIGEVVIPAGTRLGAAEIGGLMALGQTRVSVARQPRVAILSTGDEVIPPEGSPRPGQVRDVNAYSLSSLVETAGGIPLRYAIIPDQADALFAAASQALSDADMVIITAGSSASTRDLTSEVINRLGEPGVLVHGVNVRPGKPSILGICDGKAVIGLPGNPVSALVIARLFIAPAIAAWLGVPGDRPAARVGARLSLNLASQAGREDWIPVRLVQEAGSYTAEPVFGKSNLIFTLVRADGLLRIAPDATGLQAGEPVEVVLL